MNSVALRPRKDSLHISSLINVLCVRLEGADCSNEVPYKLKVKRQKGKIPFISRFTSFFYLNRTTLKTRRERLSDALPRFNCPSLPYWTITSLHCPTRHLPCTSHHRCRHSAAQCTQMNTRGWDTFCHCINHLGLLQVLAAGRSLPHDSAV